MLTTRSELEKSEETALSIIAFAEEYKNESSRYENCRIWNYDQTGFAYEPSNLRTLSFKGERDTHLMIDTANRHTHSYTVQPMISRDGKLFPKLLIVTQEPSENFGPILRPKIAALEREYGNIEVFPSKSGKQVSGKVVSWNL